MLGNVNYLTGEAFDMRAIAKAAHAKGCVAGFNLAHGAGNLALRLHDDDVDFAVWCSYKYLNAGPGGLAGCFVHERHATGKNLPRFAGWWGHNKETRFQMDPLFDPIPGAEGWQLSNPPIFQLAALRASMEIFDEATMPAIRGRASSSRAISSSCSTAFRRGFVKSSRRGNRNGAALSFRFVSRRMRRGWSRSLPTRESSAISASPNRSGGAGSALQHFYRRVAASRVLEHYASG